MKLFTHFTEILDFLQIVPVLVNVWGEAQRSKGIMGSWILDPGLKKSFQDKSL